MGIRGPPTPMAPFRRIPAVSPVGTARFIGPGADCRSAAREAFASEVVFPDPLVVVGGMVDGSADAGVLVPDAFKVSLDCTHGNSGALASDEAATGPRLRGRRRGGGAPGPRTAGYGKVNPARSVQKNDQLSRTGRVLRPGPERADE